MDGHLNTSSKEISRNSGQLHQNCLWKMAHYYVVADWLTLPRCKQRFCISFIWDTLALPNVEREHDQQFGNVQYQSNICCQLFSSRPWQAVGTDLFEWKGKSFLRVVDYYSRYPEVVSLSSTSSKEVIDKMKAMFARHGIPEEVRSDSGPQYASEIFAQFVMTFCIQQAVRDTLNRMEKPSEWYRL